MSGHVIDCRIRVVGGIISTDDIIPARYKYVTTDPQQMARHVFENLLPGFAATLAEGDALYCPATFGIGSSREQAVSALQAAGVVAVIAPRFGRIFFRNAWNLGLLALEAGDLDVDEGERVTIDLESGTFSSRGGTRRLNPPAREMLLLREAGGLLARVKARVTASPEGGASSD
ncbi:MAG TPA: 3-isopropylmalate dehydratase [Pyrinomonadaceae bacterium]|jgi:3-isopropylmalate/(R)-2-methylmalate dehydratase small subunit